ncbi:hypothetical protein BGZ58_010563 [Dissophora ornata]|nr:hypothetical protein BGZ58_010563 [Dissophora ornata]
MWNDPNLDAHWGQPTPSRSDPRDKRNRDKKVEELTAFGYESFLFHNDGVSEAIEQGHLLITWQGQDPQDENALWLDRYDVRNLLDEERFFSGPRQIHDDNFLQESSDLDEDRFEDLDSDEELLFDMDEDEREEHLARKREENEASDYKGVQYEYEKDKADHIQESSFQLHFEVPEGMAVPDSEKTLALIERTAKFVNNSSEPTMEIILQAKQATNPNFAFMSRRHHLFQFYKHVRWLMQTGLYESAEDVRQREAEEAKAEEEEEARRAVETAKAQQAALHFDIEKVIERTIEFLNTNPHTAFEEKLQLLDDSRFAFLKSSHAWHEYFNQKRREAEEEQHTRDGDRAETNPTALFLTHLEMEDQLPSKASICQESDEQKSFPTASLPSNLQSREARAVEMRRLDRLQRVKELLQRKHKKATAQIKVKIKVKVEFKGKVEVKVKVDITEFELA